MAIIKEKEIKSFILGLEKAFDKEAKEKKNKIIKILEDKQINYKTNKEMIIITEDNQNIDLSMTGIESLKDIIFKNKGNVDLSNNKMFMLWNVLFFNEGDINLKHNQIQIISSVCFKNKGDADL